MFNSSSIAFICVVRRSFSPKRKVLLNCNTQDTEVRCGQWRRDPNVIHCRIIRRTSFCMCRECLQVTYFVCFGMIRRVLRIDWMENDQVKRLGTIHPDLLANMEDMLCYTRSPHQFLTSKNTSLHNFFVALARTWNPFIIILSNSQDGWHWSRCQEHCYHRYLQLVLFRSLSNVK